MKHFKLGKYNCIAILIIGIKIFSVSILTFGDQNLKEKFI